jgi:Sigma-54, DNA binding domain/Sigma-54 factor, Activator interacting domain (AID)
VVDKLKLSHQLVMTPQLQMAIKLLATPTGQLPALVDEWRAQHPGCTVALPLGAPDPADERELAEADAYDQPEFWLHDDSPLPPDPRADVWIFGNPPEVRANGRAFPRLMPYGEVEIEREAARWFIRALRNRAKAYETVMRGIVTLRPELAVARDGKKLALVPVRGIAEAIQMHESTVKRVTSACQFQNVHGVFALETRKFGIGIRPL